MYWFGTEINLIWTLLAVLCFTVTGLGWIMNYVERLLPQALCDVFHYGKTSKTGHKKLWIVQVTEVPKSYYQHFYIFASTVTSIFWVLCLCVYQFGLEVPRNMIHVLDFMATSNRQSHTSPEAAFLAMSLFLVHVARRLYETTWVNVWSSAKMNLFHYILAFIHYWVATVGILVEAPTFAHPFEARTLKWANISTCEVLMIVLFLYSWWQQHLCAKILASLRSKSGSGQPQYSIPMGGWFTYLSCPHYFFEVLLYVSLSGLLGWNHQSYVMIALWVICNQTVLALMSHFWYQEKFKAYPKERRAIFPFIL